MLLSVVSLDEAHAWVLASGGKGGPWPPPGFSESSLLCSAVLVLTSCAHGLSSLPFFLFQKEVPTATLRVAIGSLLD